MHTAKNLKEETILNRIIIIKAGIYEASRKGNTSYLPDVNIPNSLKDELVLLGYSISPYNNIISWFNDA